MPADTKIIELRQFLAERLPRARLGVAPERMVPATLPTGIESIDQGLGGGLPQGAFTELVPPEKAPAAPNSSMHCCDTRPRPDVS